MKKVIDQIHQLMSVRSDNPELRKAQFAALSRLIPLMYFILMANAWVLTVTFYDKAPRTHTVHAALALTVICALRLALWWKKKDTVITADVARRELLRTNIFAALLGIAFSAWGFALFRYGDAFAQAHVAFFMAISMITCMFCLIHTRPAALIIAVTAGIPFLVFFISTGVPVLAGMAVNVTLVVAAAVVIILIQNRDFAHMINARTEARRREQEQSRLLRMIDDMPVAVMTVDPKTFDINYVNETSRRTIGRIEHLLPIKADDLVGTSIDVFHKRPEHQRRILSDPANLPHRTRIRLGPEVLDLQVSAVTDDDGSYLGPMLAWAIVTREVEAESRIRQLAHYDTLTGLPNRNTFREQLHANLVKPGSQLGLLSVDLDGFKIVNDTRGHHVGDALLRQVAKRLLATCGEPGVMVARLGGDEFAILIPRHDHGKAEVLATAIVSALSAPYHLGQDRQIRIGASVGIALAPAHGEDSETLLSHADIALYVAKAAGKGSARMFSTEMESRIKARVRLEAKLRTTLENREGLFVFYQPIISIETGQVTAREALLRWHHPARGWISPGEFVPIAEDSGLIEPLGLFVLNSACREAVRWKDGARVAVNISVSQLGKGTLVSAVQEALTDSGLPPERLEVEVTETALLNHEADGIADLRRLREMGVRVALDDFGTGYSSLVHLRALPFDKIKIDGSFVRDAVDRPDCAAVVRAVAELGKRLGATTVAEGVETQAQLDRIRSEGCDEVQGYLYGRPMPSDRDRPLVDALNQSPCERPTTAATI